MSGGVDVINPVAPHGPGVRGDEDVMSAEVQEWLERNPMHHIEIQQRCDEHLHETIGRNLKETERREDRLFKINHYLSMIEEALRKTREEGSDHLDLSTLEEGRGILHEIWEQLREDYPDLMGHMDSPIPPSLDLSHVDKDQASRILDQFRNAEQRDQRAIDAIARTLKLAADLNELVGRITTEKAKHDERKTMVANQTRGLGLR